MTLECITGIDSLEVGDIITTNYNGTDIQSRYEIIDLDKSGGRVRLLNHDWFPILQFANRDLWRVEKQFMKYDPTQQGDTDDDI